MKKKSKVELLKKVVSHLKGDRKTFKNESNEDKELINEIKRVKKGKRK